MAVAPSAPLPLPGFSVMELVTAPGMTVVLAEPLLAPLAASMVPATPAVLKAPICPNAVAEPLVLLMLPVLATPLV
jgi:hypothetical protein